MNGISRLSPKKMVIYSILYYIIHYSMLLRVFENRVLRRIFGPKRDEVTGELRNYIMRSLMICTSRPNIVRVIKTRRVKLGGGHVVRVG